MDDDSKKKKIKTDTIEDNLNLMIAEHFDHDVSNPETVFMEVMEGDISAEPSKVVGMKAQDEVICESDKPGTVSVISSDDNDIPPVNTKKYSIDINNSFSAKFEDLEYSSVDIEKVCPDVDENIRPPVSSDRVTPARKKISATPAPSSNTLSPSSSDRSHKYVHHPASSSDIVTPARKKISVTPELSSTACKVPSFGRSRKDDVLPSTRSDNALHTKKGTPKTSAEKNDTIKKKIAVLYNEKHVEHSSKSLGLVSKEGPDRLVRAMWYLEGRGKIFESDDCELVTEFDEATEEDLLRVHEQSYIDFVRSYSSKGGGFLGDSTYITQESYNIARLAAGGAIKAAELVVGGQYSSSFALIRPPGHHASKKKYGGFCIFNNAAIAARYLQQKKNVKKIMIIDWDAHSGNGTMDIFYNDPSVMLVSVQRDPHHFYPRSGFASQRGDGAGIGYTVNVEMPTSSGDDEYCLVFDEIVVPLIKRYSPDLVICSCGFDVYFEEKDLQMNLTSEGFYQITKKVASVMPNNLVILLEGGYHSYVGQLSHSVINAVLDKPNPIAVKHMLSSYERSKQREIFQQTEAKVSELKKLFSIT
ncbi:MAG: histone deacetylase [Methanosarcinaceae archaeon]|nr:histone deacetylase [Methanosarcinaceae archaeon]